MNETIKISSLVDGLTVDQCDPKLGKIIEILADHLWYPETMAGEHRIRLDSKNHALFTLRCPSIPFEIDVNIHTECNSDDGTVQFCPSTPLSVQMAIKRALRDVKGCTFMTFDSLEEIEQLSSNIHESWDMSDHMFADDLSTLRLLNPGTPEFYEHLMSFSDLWLETIKKCHELFLVANSVPGFREYITSLGSTEEKKNAVDKIIYFNSGGRHVAFKNEDFTPLELLEIR